MKPAILWSCLPYYGTASQNTHAIDHVCVDRYMYICVEMCADMCRDMCPDMGVDTQVHTCLYTTRQIGETPASWYGVSPVLFCAVLLLA